MHLGSVLLVFVSLWHLAGHRPWMQIGPCIWAAFCWFLLVTAVELLMPVVHIVQYLRRPKWAAEVDDSRFDGHGFYRDAAVQLHQI